ncbi:MAG: Hsp20/alpha crystallin family protein [Nitrosopumilus sp.]|nr:Hsp20/alpha crystallin family protein [Nitrosopumilus sp.]MDH3489149.1 Hsp20/alpha crystallin family protein [Nitrosopumilus sp.]MDH3516148.1 Hsp20/alpha crystallin family protein [Nitrosopumilus sp.]MDH3565423.1 Hsp20/alpha crystallin family protein [Nitrosopumilus sp.]MDH5417051.1 Hsp20/alpha crystallin family protein [Nitrosopumilus sp.]
MRNNDFEFKMTLPFMTPILDDIEQRSLSPLSSLREYENYWMVEFDLPMVGSENINVIFNQNTITVEAKLKETYSEEKLGKITKFEYFKKSVSLPGKIDSKKITSKFEKGRLEIKIPKKIDGTSIKIN